jgi:hypothetical protein
MHWIRGDAYSRAKITGVAAAGHREFILGHDAGRENGTIGAGVCPLVVVAEAGEFQKDVTQELGDED